MRDLSTKGTNDQFREERVAAHSAEQMQMEIADLKETVKKLMENKGGGKDEVDEEAFKLLHSKDMKPPPECSGGKMYFLAWHESFTSMMRMKTARWLKLVEWIKS